jgi:hypothetical protein
MALKTIGVATLVLMLIVGAYAVYRSSVYQECTTDKAQQAGYQQEYERYATLMIHIDCLGPFAHENHGPIVAVFTIILALSTILLWFSTRDAAVAAKTAAEHIPAVERAYMFAGIGPPPHGMQIASNGVPRIKLEIRNYGATPGVLKFVYVTFSFEKPVEKKPVYVAGEGTQYEKYDVVITREDRPLLLPLSIIGPSIGVHQLCYFLGYIEYLDIFKTKHTSRFCVSINAAGNWEPIGPPAWNDWD